MNLRNVHIPENADEDVVQFIKHIIENLECECDVWITAINEHEVAKNSHDSDIDEWGVNFYVEYTNPNDVPNHAFENLVKGYYDEYELTDTFNTEENTFEAIVFESEN